ncbi:hypothetical protein ANCDUO_18723 [Ancylostoma duodenale]|uniref:Uncharacterized protein n=1 Tax=Ancylostoma duodenale TaxID=51022 RepID=A0A0C2C4H1_9BILA|nr:hypothetical protein ANCDUO_18723 [Ancylostoma duodenale]
MSRNVAANQHLVIECVPVPVEVGDTAPIYFKCRERHGFVGILTQIIEWSSELDARRQQFSIREYFLLLDSELMKSAKVGRR